MAMLTLEYDKETSAQKLYISNPFAVAWISPYRRLRTDIYDINFVHVNEIHNWRLWVKRRPELLPSKGKSPTSVLIESRLRAWLLQRFHLKLRDLSFEELCAIAQGEYLTQRHRIKLGWKKG
jgi:hypothetical protein